MCFNFFLLYFFFLTDTRTNSVLKISSITRNRNGFWLDTTGMVWRQTEMPKDQIADYAPVCTSPTIHRDEDRNRYVLPTTRGCLSTYNFCVCIYFAVAARFSFTLHLFKLWVGHTPLPQPIRACHSLEWSCKRKNGSVVQHRRQNGWNVMFSPPSTWLSTI